MLCIPGADPTIGGAMTLAVLTVRISPDRQGVTLRPEWLR